MTENIKQDIFIRFFSFSLIKFNYIHSFPHLNTYNFSNIIPLFDCKENYSFANENRGKNRIMFETQHASLCCK